jgi:hypothetical protein
MPFFDLGIDTKIFLGWFLAIELGRSSSALFNSDD